MASRSDDGEGRAQHNAVSKHSDYQPLSVTLWVTAPPRGAYQFDFLAEVVNLF